MSIDDAVPGAHRREVDQAKARSHHVPSSRRDEWVDPLVAQDRYLEALAEEIRGIEDELASKRAEYERVRRWEPTPTERPSVDPRCFDLGTDQTERAS